MSDHPCRLFHPGHNVHPIQLKLSYKGSWTDVQLIRVDGLFADVFVEDAIQTWRFHEGAATILESWRPGVRTQMSDFGALRIGARLVYPCRSEASWVDCTSEFPALAT